MLSGLRRVCTQRQRDGVLRSMTTTASAITDAVFGSPKSAASGSTPQESVPCERAEVDHYVDERPQVASKRVRQHVNPLAQQYREPIEIPNWSECFEQPEVPIHLDIGCARGRYLNSLAARAQGKLNFVGVEIRKSVLEEATEEAQQRKLRNIAFVHANMNFQQRLLIPSFPARVQSVSIFHPDPWMKKRHIKRRLVTDEFVRELADLLDHDTPVFVQTDVQELYEYMVEIFNGSGLFRMEPLPANPFVVPTDREKFVMGQGGDIYRITMRVAKETGVESPTP
ncbi:hypothetical protein PINS_up009447 [Pythium insidiosum]|nr:hypothetical protein PINS_up009447 [Pythium insidiosum]